MILVDTNALVALAEPRDGLNRNAVADLKRLRGKRLLLTSIILCEAGHFLPHAMQRRRLRAVIEELDIEPLPLPDEREFWRQAFEWLALYADHQPDLADAFLVTLCSENRALRVWTYDEEFRTIWRRSDGSRVPLAPSRLPRPVRRCT